MRRPPLQGLVVLDLSRVLTIRPPFFLDDFADAPPLAPPRLGEDTEKLFAEVGLSADG